MASSAKKKIGIGCGSCGIIFLIFIIAAAVSGTKDVKNVESTTVQSVAPVVEISPLPVFSPSPSPTPVKLSPTPKATKTQTPVLQPTETQAPKPPVNNCDPNYSGTCVPIASDVDCDGGSGNGPAYVRGPVYVTGTDIYDLDRDGNGVGCE